MSYILNLHHINKLLHIISELLHHTSTLDKILHCTTELGNLTSNIYVGKPYILDNIYILENLISYTTHLHWKISHFKL